MKKDNKKPVLSFEPGSRQPFLLYLISVTIISSVVIIVCLFAGGLSFEKKSDVPAVTGEFLLGDVDLDGVVDSGDSLLLSNYLANQKNLNELQLKNADIDSNGVIDSVDSDLILQIISDKAPVSTAPSPEQITSEIDNETADSDNESQTSEQTTSQPAINIDFQSSGKAENAAFLTSESGIYYVSRIVNSWQGADSKYMYQIEVTVKNNSEKTVYNTSADVVFSNDITVEEKWDCSTETQGSTVSLKTQNDGRIKSGGSFRCGFIISAGSPVEINSIVK